MIVIIDRLNFQLTHLIAKRLPVKNFCNYFEILRSSVGSMDYSVPENTLASVHPSKNRLPWSCDLSQLLLSKTAKSLAVTDVPEHLTYLGYGFEKNSTGFVSVDKQLPRSAVNRNRLPSTPKRNRRQITLLSDGILSEKDFACGLPLRTANTIFPFTAVTTSMLI